MQGLIFNRILPEALKIAAVQGDPKSQACDDNEKTKLGCSSSYSSSISTRQRQLSASSLFKGCLPLWDLRSTNGSPKGGEKMFPCSIESVSITKYYETDVTSRDWNRNNRIMKIIDHKAITHHWNRVPCRAKYLVCIP